MYFDPYVFGLVSGVVFTILLDMILLLIAAIRIANKRGGPKK